MLSDKKIIEILPTNMIFISYYVMIAVIIIILQIIAHIF